MGDAGSLYLGFLLSYIGLKIKVDTRETSQFFVPAVVLGVALLDTTLVVVSRIRRGISPFEGGKDHISHRLMRLGVSVRRGVTIILLAACMLGCIGIALSKAKSDVGYWMLAALASMALVTTVLLTTKRAVLTVVADAADGSKSVA
jgi:UDP-GlcNAc:undecaprenyl-phosphate GlcNAc-1-phosphate transferase